ncbi:hypothetical protein TNCV_2081961 [Trichonephila clavipes]|nr:hypothetical protein TNCV_2081961 [Trichonephila clavipes]
MVTPTLMSNEASIYLILAEVAVHYHAMNRTSWDDNGRVSPRTSCPKCAPFPLNHSRPQYQEIEREKYLRSSPSAPEVIFFPHLRHTIPAGDGNYNGPSSLLFAPLLCNRYWGGTSPTPYKTETWKHLRTEWIFFGKKFVKCVMCFMIWGFMTGNRQVMDENQIEDQSPYNVKVFEHVWSPL